MSFLGRPSIHPVPFVLGKLAFLVSFGFPAARYAGLVGPRGQGSALWPLALAAAAGALALLALSLVHLGGSTRMGLPAEPTALKTSGVYRVSRNPMYLGLYLGCFASCLFAPHPLNLACAAAGIAVHHRIVLAEERFLARRFGQEWERYRARVRRYV